MGTHENLEVRSKKLEVEPKKLDARIKKVQVRTKCYKSASPQVFVKSYDIQARTQGWPRGGGALIVAGGGGWGGGGNARHRRSVELEGTGAMLLQNNFYKFDWIWCQFLHSEI